MADNTRLQKLTTDMQRVFDTLERHEQHGTVVKNRLERVENQLTAMQNSLDSITCLLDRMATNPHSEASNSSPMVATPSTIVPSLQMRHVKLDFPRFDGSEPLNWLFRAEQYFTYYQTPDAERLTIASVPFEGSVIPWFQMLQKAHLIPTWSALAGAVEEQFGPSPFDFPRAKLFKLIQSGSVVEYYNEFMVLAHRSEGLSDLASLDCFLSGLKDHIKRDVLAQSPPTLLKAVALARLFDERMMVGLSIPSGKPNTSAIMKPTPISSVPSFVSRTAPTLPSSAPPLLPTPPAKPSSSVRRMSPAEQQLRREKGLCFTCDAKYSSSHKCPNKQLMFFEMDADSYEPPPDPLPPDTTMEGDTSIVFHHLSLHAFYGSPGWATIHFQGFILGKPVRVLLDVGSDDNFIQPRLAHLLQLPIQPAPHIKVMVGDGYFLQAEGLITEFPVTISAHRLLFPALCFAYFW